jgi:HEAT repeat protein
MGNIGPLAAKEAITPLVTELKWKPSWEVRKACAFALGRVGSNAKDGPEMRVVTPLLTALKDECGEVRLQALSSLDALGFPKETENKLIVKRFLIDRTNNERNKVIVIWARVLLIRQEMEGILSSRETAKHLDFIATELQKDVDPQNRSHAAFALGRVGAQSKEKTPALKEKIPVLIAALKDPQPAVAGSAIGALGMLKAQLDEKDLMMIVKYLDPMESPEIRAFAAQTLGVVDARSRIPLLIQHLTDADEPVAIAATGALAQMKDALSKPQLDQIAQMLKPSDKNPKLETRCRAAAALGAIGQKSQIPVLVEALRDKESMVASSAVSALAAMNDQLAAADVVAIKNLAFDKVKPVETRCHAIHLLGLLGRKAKVHVPDLITLLRDKETRLVLFAVMALGRMGKDAESALPELTELKKNHRETYVREAADTAIKEITKQEKESKAAAK